MLVTLLLDRNLNDGEFRRLCDVLIAGNDFANCDISRVAVRRVIRPAKQDGKVIRRRSVGEEDTVQDCISCRRLEGFPDIGTTVGA